MMGFTISETGIGMTEEQLGRLFEPFSQVDNSTTKKYGGTGLGLAITRKFCQILGGDISVTSRFGEGSTFTISLPDLPSGTAAPARVDMQRISGAIESGTTVLIVDDDPAAHELLTATLKREGYRLVHAQNAEEALGLARAVRPNAITLDVIMPKMDGWALLSALKADRELRDIPVIMVTVVPDRGIGISLGAAEVLTKPVDRERLTMLLRQLLPRDGAILVVEDDASARETIRHTVESMGLAAAEAENGRLALRWLAENTAPALILLDLMMPEMDGFEFLDSFKANPKWCHIPVIVITAKQLTAVERSRLLNQAQKVISKSTSTDDVVAAIKEAVRQQPSRAVSATPVYDLTDKSGG
jgi:CheY-like chemotaxis protein